MQPQPKTAARWILPAITCLSACDRPSTPTETLPGAGGPPPAFHSSNDNGGLKVVPFVFVGTAAECGIAGSRIVTSAWLGGMGLPDNGGANFNPVSPADAPNKNDPHHGLLLSKNGETEICSSAGARILGVRGMVLTATSELGFDNRNGGHCSGGAVRFNVVWKDPATHAQNFSFVGGCGNDQTPTLAPQDPLEWTRVRFTTLSALEAFPPIPPGSIVVSITLLHDEGTDTPTPASGNVGGVGLAVVDNIYIDGQVITRGSGFAHERDVEDDDHDDDGKKNDEDDDDDNDGVADPVDVDADGDGVEDALQVKLALPRLL